MRGVKQELFAGLIRNPPKPVAEFVSEAAVIEKNVDMHSRQHDRPVNTFLASPIDVAGVTTDAIREAIRAVVLKELRNLFQTTPHPEVISLTNVIREEVQEALGISTKPQALRE